MEKSWEKFFPEEIWHEILKRLPSKSLCRFLSVSRPWCRLISTPSFISSNLNHNLNTQTNHHIVVNVFRQTQNYDFQGYNPDDWEEEYWFYPDHQINGNSLGEPSFSPKLPFQSDSRFHTIIGSCNGLICLEADEEIILWNPSIHKFVKLPPFSITRPYYLVPGQELGFGVNLLNGDFKVVRVVREDYRDIIEDEDYMENVANSSPPLPLLEFYSLKTGIWTKITEFPFNPVVFRSSYVYLNGRSHWICVLAGNHPKSSLVSFDMSDNVFRENSLPEQLARRDSYKLLSMPLVEKECLAMAINESGRLRIWVMKEYGVLESWTNIYTFNMEPMETHNFSEMIVKNGIILSTRRTMGETGKLTCYHLTTRLVSQFDVDAYEVHINKYMESLVLLEPSLDIVST